MIQRYKKILLNISSTLERTKLSFSNAGQDKPRHNCTVQIKFRSWPSKKLIEVQWPGGQVNLASVVL